MYKWEQTFYYLSAAAMGALGLLFVILGAGCFSGSVAAIFVALKRKSGYKVF